MNSVRIAALKYNVFIAADPTTSANYKKKEKRASARGPIFV